jgi:hypothetical protein
MTSKQNTKLLKKDTKLAEEFILSLYKEYLNKKKEDC